LSCLAALLCAGEAPAGEEEGGTVQRGAGLDGQVTRQQRPFGFVSDGSTPSRGVLGLGYAFGLGSGIAADRPLPVDLAAGAGGSHTVAIGYGLTDRLSPFASATFSQSSTIPSRLSSTVMAGARYQFTDPTSPFHVALSGGVTHEGLGGTTGLTMLAAASLASGPFVMAANLQADKMFAAGRDSVDLITTAGVAVRVVGGLRVGVEYVGQDLEDAFEEDLEGGARHAVGPSVSLDLEGGRYQLTVATGFGLNAISPTAVVRAGFSFNY
jgi:hypothetical protein